MEFTEKQLKAIRCRDGNLLVSASAGSGKTTLMIERIISLIEEGNSLENMVICTFTRASASDMKDKLATALMEKASRGDEVAIRQLTLLPTAEISTIHSWCQRLIRKYFYFLDVDPAFEIVDEDEAEVMLLEAIDKAIEDGIKSADENFTEFYEAMAGRNDNALKKLIRTLYEFSRTQTNPQEFLSGKFAVYPQIQGKVNEIILEEEKRLKDRFKPIASALYHKAESIGFTKILPYVCAFLDKIDGIESEQTVRLPGKVAEEFESFKNECGEIKELYDKERKKLDEFYDLPDPDDPPTFTRVLTSLTQSAGRYYEKAKQKKAKLDYNDLEHLVCDLMQNAEIAQEISKAYKFVFVDEYQDVNPLQERVLSSIKNSNMFLVGDVKQSIYAFRMCDPGIFLSKYNNYQKYGYLPPIDLNYNFRSEKAILDFTNMVMSPLMTQRFGRVNYARDAMLESGLKKTGGKVQVTAIVNEDDALSYSGVYSVQNDIADGNESSAERESNLVVSDVLKRLSKRDENGNKISQSDIAILYSNRSERTRLIYQKLKKAGVSVSLCDSDKFSSVYEVGVLCEFLKYLCNFNDDIALVALLRSPIVGVSNGELAQIKMSERTGEKSFYAITKNYALTNNDELAIKLNDFFALVDKYYALSATRTASEIIDQLVAEKQWFNQIFKQKDGKTKADALNAFLQHLSSSPHSSSVYEYVEYLRRDNADFTPSPAVDAVRMLTIHASKGLEFKCVYLIDTTHGFNFKEVYGSVILDAELGVCMKNFDLEKRQVLSNKLVFTAGLKNKRKMLEERMRLLYVALTRAKDELNIYASIKNSDALFKADTLTDHESGTCFFDWIRPVASVWGYRLVSGADCVITKESDAVRFAPLPVDETLVKTLKEYFDTERKYAEKYESEQTRVKSSVTAMMNEQKEESGVHYALGENDDRALKKGNAYHKAMELIDFNADFDQEWERIKSQGDIEELVSKDQLRVASKKVGEFTRGKTLYREKQFILNEKGKLIQGVIDLIAVDGDRCLIVDYKTSSPKTIASGEYDLQLAVYARAASRILGLKVEKSVIYSFESGEFTQFSEKDYDLDSVLCD